MLESGLISQTRMSLILALSFIFFSSNAYSSDFNQTYSDVHFSKGEDVSISFSSSSGRYTVDYSYYHQNALYDEERLSYIISSAMNNLIAYSERYRVSYGDCIANTGLEIYEVSSSIINDGRVRALSDEHRGGVIRGYFDPILDDTSRVAIVITYNANYNTNRMLLAHELAHYFYYRMCIWRHSDVSSEDFASGFEAYYMSRI